MDLYVLSQLYRAISVDNLLDFAYLRVNTCEYAMLRAAKKSPPAVREGRQGRPQTIWFTDQQAEALESLSHKKRVTKTTLVRFAVDEMLKGFYTGQLKLPGID
jgi:hypothetical protein